MLALKDIREWVAGFGISEDSHVYIGKLDNKKERSIGVYRRKGSGPPVMALGGALQSSYDVRRISLLVHWERDPVRSEAAAMELFERIRKESDVAFRAKCKMFSRHLQKPILKTEKGRFKGL